MSLTFSTMLELGTPAPDFSLPDVVTGKTISLATFADEPALLVLFICRHCPFVRHVQAELARLGRDYREAAGIVGISSNDADDVRGRRPGEPEGVGARTRLHVPGVFRREPERGEGVYGGVHARSVPVRRETAARLSRAARRQPAG